MTSITLAVPEEVRKRMHHFPEINWSALIRKVIEQRIKELILKEQLLAQLKEEQEFTDWTVELGRKAKKGRFKKILSELSPKERAELERAKHENNN